MLIIRLSQKIRPKIEQFSSALKHLNLFELYHLGVSSDPLLETKSGTIQKIKYNNIHGSNVFIELNIVVTFKLFPRRITSTNLRVNSDKHVEISLMCDGQQGQSNQTRKDISNKLLNGSNNKRL